MTTTEKLVWIGQYINRAPAHTKDDLGKMCEYMRDVVTEEFEMKSATLSNQDGGVE